MFTLLTVCVIRMIQWVVMFKKVPKQKILNSPAIAIYVFSSGQMKDHLTKVAMCSSFRIFHLYMKKLWFITRAE